MVAAPQPDTDTSNTPDGSLVAAPASRSTAGSNTPCLDSARVKVRHEDPPPLLSALLAGSLPPSPAAAEGDASREYALGSQSVWTTRDMDVPAAESPSAWPGYVAAVGAPSFVSFASGNQADALSLGSSLSSPVSAPAFQSGPLSSPLYDELSAPTSAPTFSSFYGASLGHTAATSHRGQHPQGSAHTAHVQHGVTPAMLNTQSSCSSLGQDTVATTVHEEASTAGDAGDKDDDPQHTTPDDAHLSSNGTPEDHASVSPTAEGQESASADKSVGSGGRENTNGGRKARRDTKGLPRQFACTVCGAAFARNHDLRRHARIHMVNKPYACPTCRKQFSRKDALNRHLSVKSNCLFRRRSSAGALQGQAVGIAPGAGSPDSSHPHHLLPSSVSARPGMPYHPYGMDFATPNSAPATTTASFARGAEPGMTPQLMGFPYGTLPSPMYSTPNAPPAPVGAYDRTGAPYGAAQVGKAAPGSAGSMMYPPSSAHLPSGFVFHPSAQAADHPSARARAATVPGGSPDWWLSTAGRMVDPSMGGPDDAEGPAHAHAHGTHPHAAHAHHGAHTAADAGPEGSHVPLGFLPLGTSHGAATSAHQHGTHTGVHMSGSTDPTNQGSLWR